MMRSALRVRLTECEMGIDRHDDMGDNLQASIVVYPSLHAAADDNASPRKLMTYRAMRFCAFGKGNVPQLGKDAVI